jgi:hypothetical protein
LRCRDAAVELGAYAGAEEGVVVDEEDPQRFVALRR